MTKNDQNDGSEKGTASSKRAVPYHKRRSFKTRALGEFAPKLTKRLFGAQGMTHIGLVTDWALIVGEKYARRSQPEKMIYRGASKSKATLYIRVEGALGLEMSHIQNLLIERINQYFGFQSVTELRFSQKPLRRGLAKPVSVTRTQMTKSPEKRGKSEVSPTSIEEMVKRVGESVARRHEKWRDVIGADMVVLFPTAHFTVSSDPKRKWDIFVEYNDPTDPDKSMGRAARLRDLSEELAEPRRYIKERLEEAYGTVAIGRIRFNVNWFSERLVV